MNFDEYQRETSRTAIYPKDQAMAYLGLGLTGEAGEVANKAKKEIRDNTNNGDAIHEELGDVLWYIAQIAEVRGWSLEGIAGRNIQKLRDRHQLTLAV
jgi:NTP pyrophosphatase (non-canonical NTP hydrolase)